MNTKISNASRMIPEVLAVFAVSATAFTTPVVAAHTSNAANTAADPAAVLRGGQLARTYCVTCHLFPEPEALDRKTWMEQVLPRMKYRLGFSTAKLEQSANIKLLREHHRIPLTPVISEAQWVDLITYYIVQSPEQSLPQESAGGIELGVPGFRAAPWSSAPVRRRSLR